DLTSNDFDATLTLLSGDSRTQLVYNDDGGINRNARIGPYVLPNDGDYQIMVSGLGIPEGEYVLTLNRVNPTPIDFGKAVEGQVSGGQATYFSFEAQAGDIVDVRVDTGNEFDTALSVITPGSREIASAEDVNGGVDPSVRNVILTETGTYFIAVQPNVNRDARTPITVKVTESIIPSLDGGPQMLQFGDLNTNHLVSFTGEADEQVVIRVTFDVQRPVSPTVRVKQGEEELASMSSYKIQGELSFGVHIPDDGRVLIELQDYDYIEFLVTVSVERE